MRLWLSGPRILRGLVRPGISLDREDWNPRLPSYRRYELRHGLQEAAKARGEPMTKEDANYAIDKALATGLLDSNGNLNFHMRGTREEIIAGILTTAKAWGQLMTCDQAERIADRAIRKARWPIGNIVTIAIIAALIAVTVLAFVLGRR
jgi:hypothetical protein